MKKLFTTIIIFALMVSSEMVLSACGSSGEAQETSVEQKAEEEGIELIGISKYSRTELDMLMEFEVSDRYGYIQHRLGHQFSPVQTSIFI